MIGRWNTKSREHIKDSRFHMKRTRNIRLSRHQMFAILRLKRNGIALQRKRKGGGGLFVTKSEMLSVLPALFYQSQTSKWSGDWWPAPIWWLTAVIRRRSGRRETHSPCLYPTPARNSSRRCLSSLLSRSLRRGKKTKARGSISGQSVFRELCCGFVCVKPIVCVCDKEVCLLAFN